MARQSGFAYLLLLYIVALLAISLLAVSALEYYAGVRSDEAQLLREGSEFSRALASYHDAASPHVYPATLDELLLDRRAGGLRRHLRKIYVDPMTRTRDWELVVENGQIVGIHSRSERQPLKIAGFGPDEVGFEQAKTYADWIFRPLATTTVSNAQADQR